MSELHFDWITEGLMDFEYKKYKLLAYLQSCRASFNSHKLYPPLGELVRHYNSLHELQKSFDQLKNSFPKDLAGIDFKKLRLVYESEKMQEEELDTISEIVDFALPNFRDAIDEGKEIYELVEKNLEVSPIGLVPIYTSEGYMLLQADASADVRIYKYQHSVITGPDENLRSLSFSYLHTEQRSIANSLEEMKLHLIRMYPELPSPAAYLCYCRIAVPMEETLLPVTRRVMMRTLAA